jgi:hypothetical protein
VPKPAISSAPAAIVCEIFAADAVRAAALAEIAAALGRDVGQPLLARTVVGRRPPPAAAPTLTLHLPAEFAASQHEVWCLACRLACFCPQARVSVLVTGATFASTAAAAPLRRRSA